MFKRSHLICAAGAAFFLAGVSSLQAQVIYGFETVANYGGKTGPDGFVKNGSIVVGQTTNGATEGTYALENLTDVGSANGGTYGAAYTFDLPDALVAPSTTAVNFDLTLSDALTYYSLEPRFEMDAPDGTDDYLVGTDQNFVTATNPVPNKSTELLNLQVFQDPDATVDQTNGGPGDGDTGLYTIGQIVAQDSAFDKEQYTPYLFQLTTIAGASTDGASTVEADFDNVRLVPEPTSLGLIAVGGLLLARRRRAC